ncbi:MAG: TraR/DksA C4-type zinc finger protein [Planctomycetota bacterium]|nr:TraR/DksA C4-type zinc finger protein [Planctomycetota bacterium]
MPKNTPAEKKALKPKPAREKPAKKTPVAKAKAASKPAPKASRPAKAAESPAKPKAKARPAAKAEPKSEKARPPAKPRADEKPEKGAKAAPAAPEPKAAPVADAKTARKGITIVTPKPVRKAKAPISMANIIPSGLGRLLDPKSPRKPLIPSGPKASPARALGQHGGPELPQTVVTGVSPLSETQIEYFRQRLIRKRAELVGDVNMMEREALRSESGSLSNMPSHLAEQGSDASEQSLSLDLAAADRKLIREIDDALVRITKGTFGVCELTGKPVKLERLEELPWARYSIEAARELERHAMRS